jgi:hypothetical protein
VSHVCGICSRLRTTEREGRERGEGRYRLPSTAFLSPPLPTPLLFFSEGTVVIVLVESLDKLFIEEELWFPFMPKAPAAVVVSPE